MNMNSLLSVALQMTEGALVLELTNFIKIWGGLCQLNYRETKFAIKKIFGKYFDLYLFLTLIL
ncbi:hypothetical protein AVI51_07000 [Piscirickettsia salmonis]|uniref:Uncharacterized protein n=1 Tax=Piscirickettsia salmonis TaxID=1238 RepID=A0A9Q5VF87_PISSA|nr:hypothetical protein [Piscirickettsia salmonis]ERL61190.1 hypothetical protein K661_02476 [Piscirickettsia salmonis LF-89 = ATCC VR-1361]ALA25820.1 acetyltransferase [Piscirickettsia salmonis]APS43299.1 hypothetical protein AVI48_02195 [Piscirickettsia salmonis]APS46649.1 hypothetical protein AVI49_02800 [Piscirickettsia salmonis]APS50627.1 hypothetical protein AVI50_07085 [Piscirickettsia salmonis]